MSNWYATFQQCCTHSLQTLYCGVAEIEECVSNPCMHCGICSDGVGSFFCSCTDGYTGPMCETGTHLCTRSHSVEIEIDTYQL